MKDDDPVTSPNGWVGLMQTFSQRSAQGIRSLPLLLLLLSAWSNAAAAAVPPVPETIVDGQLLKGEWVETPKRVAAFRGVPFAAPPVGDLRWKAPQPVIPWEGAVLAGTTDLDHPQDLAIEPHITEAEVTYLMEGIQAIFPSLNISLADCLCAFAGIRPVLSEGKLKPSEESREHVVWVDRGLVTVTGGKLTTFRRLALDALKAVKSFLPPDKIADRKAPVFNEVQQTPVQEYGLSAEIWRRLYGRYGSAADTIVKAANADDLETINGTHTLWAELPYVAQNEQIRHLDDLLLRRVRIGLLTPHGGKAYLKRIQKLCKKVLPWDRRRWKEEVDMYLAQWNHAHALPVRRAEVAAQRKNISFKALGAVLRSIYYKIASVKKCLTY